MSTCGTYVPYLLPRRQLGELAVPDPVSGLVRDDLPIALAGNLPGDADGVAHHGPAVSFIQETADFLLDFAKELPVLRHQGSQVVCSRRLDSLGIPLPVCGSADQPRRHQRRETCPRADPGVVCRAN